MISAVPIQVVILKLAFPFIKFTVALSAVCVLTGCNTGPGEADRAAADGLYNEYKYKEALILYDKALQANENVEFLNARGKCKISLGEYPGALADFENGARDKDSYLSGPALLDKGVIYDRLGKKDDALACFDSGLALKPEDNHDNCQHRMAKANCLLKMQRASEALPLIEAAITKLPGWSALFHVKGAALRSLKKYDEALAAANEAVRLNDEDAEAYLDRGLTEISLLRYEDAVKDFDRSIKLQPGYATPYLARAKALTFLHKGDAAIADMKTAAGKPKLNPHWEGFGPEQLF